MDYGDFLQNLVVSSVVDADYGGHLACGDTGTENCDLPGKRIDHEMVSAFFQYRPHDALYGVHLFDPLGETAFDMTRRLALEEGIFVGMSSGAAMAGAVEVAQDMNCGTIVVIFPDRGDRYLSTALFTSICAQCPP